MSRLFNQITILPGMPPYGPMPIYFGNGSSAREGLVVQFGYGDERSWTGNFERGRSDCNQAVVFPDTDVAIVVASGTGYIIDIGSKKLLNTIEDITFAKLVPELAAVVVGDETRFEAMRSDSILWVSPRISWDGMRNIKMWDAKLSGEAYSIVDEKWHRFELDVRTGACDNSPYEASLSRIRLVQRATDS
jgi:hypothetical protein